MSWEKFGELIITAGATLGAAYWGARAAFDFNRKHEADRTEAQQIEECNRALLVLSRQYNLLLNYQQQILDEPRSDPGRHFFLPPSEPMDYKQWMVNVPALSFLMQTDAAELPFMFAVQDDHFHSSIAAINARTVAHQEFQRALAASSLPTDQELPLEVFENAVGQRITVTLKEVTDQVYALVDTAISALEIAGRDARNVLRTLYPGAKLLRFGPPSSSPQNR